MNKIKMNALITILLLMPFRLDQEDRTKLLHSLEEIDQVVIELEGNIEVNTWENRELSIDYYVYASGSVLGFSNKDKRPRYGLKKAIRGKQLSVQAKERRELKAVGLVTYTETERHVIYLPEDIHLIIKSNNGKIQVNGDFKKLIVENDGEFIGRFRQSSINSLFCRADKRKLMINGNKKDREYEFTGMGENVYEIHSRKIRLIID